MNIKKLDDKLHYDYLFNTIKKKNRFFKSRKTAKNHEDLEMLQAVFNYNITRAKEALSILNEEQLDLIRQSQFKGGLKK